MSDPWRTWMPLDIGRYLTNTGHLSTQEHGAYLLLIMNYWTKGSLPKKDQQLAQIVGLQPKRWQAIKPTIAAFFRPDWSHKTVEEEMMKAEERYRKRVGAGHLGGVKKASNAKALPTQQRSNATPELGQDHSNALANTNTPSNDGVWASVRERVLAAFATAGSPNIPDTSRVEIWRAHGRDPEICLAVVAEVVNRKPSISSLGYFDKAIADAHVAPQGQARAGPAARVAKPTHFSVLQEDLGHGPASHHFEINDRAGDPSGGATRHTRVVQEPVDRQRREALAAERRAERLPAFVDDGEDG